MEYIQPNVILFSMPVEVISQIVVTLNGGRIEKNVIPQSGYLYPGYRGGRELHYFKISRDAMTFWKHVCKYLRSSYDIDEQTYNLLLSDNAPEREMWTDPDIEEYGSCFWDDYHNSEHYVPRHLYAGKPEPWIMQLCDGPQTSDKVDEEVNIAD